MIRGYMYKYFVICTFSNILGTYIKNGGRGSINPCELLLAAWIGQQNSLLYLTTDRAGPFLLADEMYT